MLDDLLLCGAVGVAAFNIGGATLHSALKLPVENGHGGDRATSKYKQLRGEALQDLQHAWRDVRYLIIDEISMVSKTQLQNASKRLQEVTGKRGVPFGGLSVITVGDFYQLPPVKAHFVFHNPHGLWCQNFQSKFQQQCIC